jgi:hypothetical protein
MASPCKLPTPKAVKVLSHHRRWTFWRIFFQSPEQRHLSYVRLLETLGLPVQKVDIGPTLLGKTRFSCHLLMNPHPTKVVLRRFYFNLIDITGSIDTEWLKSFHVSVLPNRPPPEPSKIAIIKRSLTPLVTRSSNSLIHCL